MFRGEGIICGTSTTGTGTLTLAAAPTPPGGVDLDVLARATGNNFGNSAAVLTSYNVIEYTDSTFATAKQSEKGIGALTLGSSSGIANATLARTKIQTTATSLNSQPASYNTNAPSAINIGTAANTLVFIGPSSADLMDWTPYFDSGSANYVYPLNTIYNTVAGGVLVSGTDYYVPFIWGCPMLVKRLSTYVQVAYSGGTPVSNAYGRIYAIASNGLPGKLLYDFGLIGSSGTSLNGTGVVQSAASGAGFFLTPGEYFFDFICSLSGGTTPPKLLSPGTTGGWLNPGKLGQNYFTPNNQATATSGTAGAAPDPANTTSFVPTSGGGFNHLFAFGPS